MDLPVYDLIEQHYMENERLLRKKYARITGTVWAGEDVVQEAYTRALKYRSSFDANGLFDKWFSRILRNALLDFQAAERGHASDEYPEEDVEGSDNPQYYLFLYKELINKINSYEEPYREILTLYFDKGFSCTDIAKIVDMKKKTIDQYIWRFKSNLKEEHAECLDRGLRS